MNDKNKRINTQLELDKGKEALRQAEILAAHDAYDGKEDAVQRIAEAKEFIAGVTAYLQSQGY